MHGYSSNTAYRDRHLTTDCELVCDIPMLKHHLELHERGRRRFQMAQLSQLHHPSNALTVPPLPVSALFGLYIHITLSDTILSLQRITTMTTSLAFTLVYLVVLFFVWHHTNIVVVWLCFDILAGRVRLVLVGLKPRIASGSPCNIPL